jgi:hypothetical protein
VRIIQSPLDNNRQDGHKTHLKESLSIKKKAVKDSEFRKRAKQMAESSPIFKQARFLSHDNPNDSLEDPKKFWSIF